MCGHLRHSLFDVQRIARIDDGQAEQRAAHLHVQVFFGDHLMDEVVGAARAEHRVGGGKRHQPDLGHAPGGGHEQLLGHVHLVEAVGVSLCEEVQVSTQADDLGPPGCQRHQSLAEGGRLRVALPR
ncbi:hypothetical protein VITFI_CDS1319 [Vitreoscilla filiformis]|uniref:Uncharacterized protein n=1 Tax=Vitreoscilla filiformis TaxID=63 RepID=A0A221KE25_VITFI|nr:hypothetical protein VITFI_CDS1319 [Vitreoscilla filiformis]